MKRLIWLPSAAIFGLAVLNASPVLAGMSENVARQLCRSQLHSVLPGARVPVAKNLADGSVSHYLVWEGRNTISRSDGKHASASCVVNMESAKLYLTVSGRDYPAIGLADLAAANAE
jgi:hypothetical protein